MSRADQDIDSLPLRPAVFAILMTLSRVDLHGYGLMQAANEHLGHKSLLGPGTLYRTLKELRELAWIEHAPSPDGDDERRQYYRLTTAGAAVARAESQRLVGLIGAEVLSSERAR